MSGKKRILLIEDNDRIMEANRRVLTRAGYSVEMARNLGEARACLSLRGPDAIVLDIMLPDGNGLDFIAEIRTVTNAPVLLLTALDSRDDRLSGLRAGGDDYITKPYDLEELRERIAAFLRREALHHLSPIPEKLEKGPLALDMRSQQAYLNGDNLLLTPKEYLLLLLLFQNEGSALTTETLYETVWKTPWIGNGDALWKHMSRLKQKLSINSRVHLKLLRGKGYRLDIMS